MKALTPNHRRILWGLLIVTVGLSKSWLQTASHSIDLAATTSESQTQGPILDKIYTVSTGKDEVSFRTIVTNEKIDNYIKGADGQFKKDPDPKYKTVASFPDSCAAGACLDNLDLNNVSNFSDIEKLIKGHLDVLARSGKLKASKVADNDNEESESEADCDTKVVNGKTVDISSDAKYAKDHYRCLRDKFSTSEEYADRESRREAFQSEIVDELQEELMNAETDRERREIMKKIRVVKAEFRSDSVLAGAVTRLERGAKDMNRVAELSRAMALNPGQSSQYLSELNSIAFRYNMQRNPQLNCGISNTIGGGMRNSFLSSGMGGSGCYSSSTRESIGDWAKEIFPLAEEALYSPSSVASRFYPEEEFQNIGGNSGFGPGGNRIGQIGSRLDRTDVRMYGIHGLPRFGEPFGGDIYNSDPFASGGNFSGNSRFGYNGGFGSDRFGGNRFGSDRNRFGGGSNFDGYSSSFGSDRFGGSTQMNCQPSRYGYRASSSNYSSCGNYPVGTGFSQWRQGSSQPYSSRYSGQLPRYSNNYSNYGNNRAPSFMGMGSNLSSGWAR